ncbi:MAG TPA: alcohol dehydrogenase catalytic domain-containing protein, partial [Acidimicrobiales bacterium]|nr:alcohol dehydrogenase catalytic domain-containing protein [Acidimicrobiales bacterium]
MRAALCRTYGPPEVVRVESVATRALGPGQVRVRVNVAAVNLPDVLIIADKYQVTVPLPFIPGSEFAGVVVERAGDVYQFDVDERVFGTSLVGAFAEEVVVSAQSLSRTPSSIGDRDAAALGVAHRTAFHVLKSAARVEHGDDLVVLGAGGGVGLACVELGALFGTR